MRSLTRVRSRPLAVTLAWVMTAVGIANVGSVYAGQASAPPDLDCALTFDAQKSKAGWLPGGTTEADSGFDTVTLEAAQKWKSTLFFTRPDHAAHPAVVMRIRRKQVTDVWTSESKGCGYGNQAAFVALMAEMKLGDSELTDASRAEVEAKKKSRSPLLPGP